MADEVKTTVTEEPAGAEEKQTEEPAKTPEAEADIEIQRRADALVAKRLKGMPSKDELAAFRKWQDEQKTPEQKESEELAKVKREAEEYRQKLTAFENEKKVLQKGVSPAFAEFVAFSVGKAVTDDTDFDTALASFVKANPQYAEKAAPGAQLRTGMSQGSTAPVPENQAYLDKKYGNNPYYKK